MRQLLLIKQMEIHPVFGMIISVGFYRISRNFDFLNSFSQSENGTQVQEGITKRRRERNEGRRKIVRINLIDMLCGKQTERGTDFLLIPSSRQMGPGNVEQKERGEKRNRV